MGGPRPLPERLELVAFPMAAGGSGQAPLLICADASEVQLPAVVPDWLTLQGPETITRGLSRVECLAAANARATRAVRLAFRVQGRDWWVRITQQPGLLVQTEQIRLLNAPLNIEMLVLVGFVASLINDIEVPPIQLIVTVLAVLALIALGVILALLRHLFAAVPEPKPVSTDTLGQPVHIVPGLALSGVLPVTTLAVEDQTIALQTVKSIYWLLRQIE